MTTTKWLLLETGTVDKDEGGGGMFGGSEREGKVEVEVRAGGRETRPGASEWSQTVLPVSMLKDE